MKANELMLGNYIKIAIANTGYLRVTAIYPDAVVAEDSCGVDDCYPITIMSGIPLTPEILKKNGFDFLYSSVPGGTPQEQRMRKVDTYEWQGLAVNYYHETNDFQMVNFRGVRLNYVHQFQHALRLCGIEKEIVL